MDVVRKCRITIDFDVWEPLDKAVTAEIDYVTKCVRSQMHHAANVRVSTVEVLEVKKL